jgi:hypothetical protein
MGVSRLCQHPGVGDARPRAEHKPNGIKDMGVVCGPGARFAHLRSVSGIRLTQAKAQLNGCILHERLDRPEDQERGSKTPNENHSQMMMMKMYPSLYAGKWRAGTQRTLVLHWY